MSRAFGHRSPQATIRSVAVRCLLLLGSSAGARAQCPADVANVVVEPIPGGARLTWDDLGAGVIYDIFSVDRAALVTSGGDYSVGTCVAEGIPVATYDDLATPPGARSAELFLVRARGACGVGTYGDLNRDATATAGALACAQTSGPDPDGDGWALADGDCCESSLACPVPALVNPGAVEFLGNGLDDDCDPATSDSVPASACSSAADFSGLTADQLAGAMELCQAAVANPALSDRSWGLVTAALVLPDGSNPNATQLSNMQNYQTAVLANYGSGGVLPQAGLTMAGLSNGRMRDQNDAGYVNPNGGTNWSSAGLPPAAYLAAHGGALPGSTGCAGDCPAGSGANDGVNLRLTLRAPTNASAFSYRYRFFSAEYSTWACTIFNDLHLSLLTSSAAGIPADRNLALDASGNPTTVNSDLFDICVPQGCYTCPLGSGELAGTGMQVSNTGGGTGWVTVTAPVVPGETFVLDLMVFDVSDGAVDSLVLVDDFRWIAVPATEVACADGFDNDSDAVSDCLDPDCDGIAGCELGQELTCDDALDNDGDGGVDCADTDCSASPACMPESSCSDGLDNDLDGVADCLDFGCQGIDGCEFGQELTCADGLDNDGDAAVDCVDPDCATALACASGPDQDGDGWAPADGDCCESTVDCPVPALVNPGAVEFLGNALDDDCDPATSDSVPPSACSLAADFSGLTADQLAGAMDICQITAADPPLPDRSWGLVTAALVRPDGSAPSAPQVANMQNYQTAVLVDYGTGGVVPQAGLTMAGLSNGRMRDQNDVGYVNPNAGTNLSSPGLPPAAYLAAHGGALPGSYSCAGQCTAGAGANDGVNLRLSLRAPTNANAFSYRYRFFSADYWVYSCTTYNDFHLSLLTTGAAGIPADRNLALDASGNPITVNNDWFDVCVPQGCHTCPLGSGALAGTGMQLGNIGGGTAWVTVTAPVIPGETFVLELMVFDVTDGIVDSLVLLDDFRWIPVPTTEVACDDGLDNDSDAVSDCLDPDCDGIAGCELGQEVTCDDAVDNDGDGGVDCADADCATWPACIPETLCDDGLDNDLDGATDCLDLGCDGIDGCQFGQESTCNDALDNDGDGAVDCADPDCATAPACTGGPDQDGDGWAPADGDCCESSLDCPVPALVNPGAVELLGNGLDDDCDPATSDSVPPSACSLASDFSGVTADQLAGAMELCRVAAADPPLPDRTWGLIGAALVRPDGTAPTTGQLSNMQDLQSAVLVDYGTGGVAPQAGATMAGLANGRMRDQNDAGYLNPYPGSNLSSVGVPPAAYLAAHGGSLPGSTSCFGGCPAGAGANDGVNLRLTLRAPTNVSALSYRYRFFSADYWAYVCTNFNDLHLSLLTSGAAGIPADRNLAFDASGNPISVNSDLFDICVPQGCYTCPLGSGELAGTGMQVSNTGGGTGWVTVTAPVVPGETFTLELMVFDVSDHTTDSLVLLDDFRWIPAVP